MFILIEYVDNKLNSRLFESAACNTICLLASFNKTTRNTKNWPYNSLDGDLDLVYSDLGIAKNTSMQ
jgi:hypothetical protein